MLKSGAASLLRRLEFWSAVHLVAVGARPLFALFLSFPVEAYGEGMRWYHECFRSGCFLRMTAPPRMYQITDRCTCVYFTFVIFSM